MIHCFQKSNPQLNYKFQVDVILNKRTKFIRIKYNYLIEQSIHSNRMIFFNTQRKKKKKHLNLIHHQLSSNIKWRGKR